MAMCPSGDKHVNWGLNNSPGLHHLTSTCPNEAHDSSEHTFFYLFKGHFSISWDNVYHQMTHITFCVADEMMSR